MPLDATLPNRQNHAKGLRNIWIGSPIGVTTVADETHSTEESATHSTGNNGLTLGFSFLAGLGMVTMMTAAGAGVIQGDTADDMVIGLLFAAGLGAFVVGLAAWMGVTQPWAHFDDINEPQYHGHAHDNSHADEDHTPSLAAADESPALPAETH